MFRIFQLKWKSIPFSWQRIYLRAQHSITVREEKHCKSNPVCLYFYNNVCLFKFIRLSVISTECRFLVTPSPPPACDRRGRRKFTFDAFASSSPKRVTPFTSRSRTRRKIVNETLHMIDFWRYRVPLPWSFIPVLVSLFESRRLLQSVSQPAIQ